MNNLCLFPLRLNYSRVFIWEFKCIAWVRLINTRSSVLRVCCEGRRYGRFAAALRRNLQRENAAPRPLNLHQSAGSAVSVTNWCGVWQHRLVCFTRYQGGAWRDAYVYVFWGFFSRVLSPYQRGPPESVKPLRARQRKAACPADSGGRVILRARLRRNPSHLGQLFTSASRASIGNQETAHGRYQAFVLTCVDAGELTKCSAPAGVAERRFIPATKPRLFKSEACLANKLRQLLLPRGVLLTASGELWELVSK